MIIKVSEIPEEGLEVDFIKRLDSLHVDAKAHMVLKRIGADVVISGNAETQVSLECGRCLDNFQQNLAIHIELTSSSEQTEVDSEVELSEEEILRGFMDDEIDLGHMVDEHVLLNMPMRPLCSEDCKGLCPSCGTDLNKGECGCSHDKVDPRLQVLRKLLNKGENE